MSFPLRPAAQGCASTQSCVTGVQLLGGAEGVTIGAVGLGVVDAAGFGFAVDDVFGLALADALAVTLTDALAELDAESPLIAAEIESRLK